MKKGILPRISVEQAKDFDAFERLVQKTCCG